MRSCSKWYPLFVIIFYVALATAVTVLMGLSHSGKISPVMTHRLFLGISFAAMVATVVWIAYMIKNRPSVRVNELTEADQFTELVQDSK